MCVKSDEQCNVRDEEQALSLDATASEIAALDAPVSLDERHCEAIIAPLDSVGVKRAI